MIIHVRTAHRRCQAQIVAEDMEQKHGKQRVLSGCTTRCFRINHGAGFARSDAQSVSGFTCLKIEGERDVWCRFFFFLTAAGERTELEQETWSAALVMVHVETGLSCFTSVEKKGAVGVPVSRDASSTFFEKKKKRQCFGDGDHAN